MKLLERLEAAIVHARAEAKAEGTDLSERDISTKAGLSSGYLGRTKTALRDNPDYSPSGKTMSDLARALGVNSTWLISGEGSMLSSDGARGVAASFPNLLVTSHDALDQDGLTKVLDSFDWPEGFTPEQVSAVIRNVRASAFKAFEQLPERYWHGEVTRLCREELGTAKRVHVREQAESAEARDARELAEERQRRADAKAKAKSKKRSS